ncbi:MOB kinase activator-like 3 [Blattella germanica]|nr:MOB kinase activator-like 3 [Blattella germanica]
MAQSSVCMNNGTSRSLPSGSDYNNFRSGKPGAGVYFLCVNVITMALSGFVEFFQKGKAVACGGHMDGTFRPKKRFEPGTLRYSLHKQAQASLNSGINLRSVVQLPQGGPKFEYLWADGGKYKKPTPLPAPQYVALLMDWVESQINNESLFPVSTDVPFPKSFVSLCRKILTRLFRVFVHVYIHHFDRIVAIGAEPHVNTCYKHFYYFVREFDLVSSKELEPLKEMTAHICRDYSDPPTTSS